MFITRKAEFSASHICAQQHLSEEQNHELYGAAANPNGHGHNYVLEVTLSGDPDPSTGMIFDLKKLKEILNQTVIEPMDHRFLNYEVRPFDKLVPTTENLCIEIFRRLAAFPRAKLERVRVEETNNNSFEYAGGPEVAGH